ncbi:MAG: hypothetical protein Q8885_00675 [Candidatus Phytoplasma stylosanthis]|nr:hypothetical protein [Candidatus Phytoplasma stylosanthis]
MYISLLISSKLYILFFCISFSIVYEEKKLKIVFNFNTIFFNFSILFLKSIFYFQN